MVTCISHTKISAGSVAVTFWPLVAVNLHESFLAERRRWLGLVLRSGPLQ